MTSPRVLLVEDEAIIAMALAFGLEAAGYSVAIARNGREALRKLQESKPDVVITDYMMPHMDGGELIRHIRANAALADIPVVMLTAIPEANLAGKVEGYSAHLRKPVHEGELLTLLGKLLGR